MERIGNFFPGRFEKPQVVKGGGSVVQQGEGNGDLDDAGLPRLYLSLVGPGGRCWFHGSTMNGKNKKEARYQGLSNPAHDPTPVDLF